MSETEDPVPATDPETKTKSLNTKKIRRRLEVGGTDAKAQRKKRNKMALSILRQIAKGRISNPAAAAKAFIDAKPKAAKDEDED